MEKISAENVIIDLRFCLHWCTINSLSGGQKKQRIMTENENK